MKKELITFQEPKSPVSEVFRKLRTNIQFMNSNRKMKTLLITSCFPEEGKSWVASNTAVAFAQTGKKVILVDADMRKGRQYNIFDIAPTPGLSNYLSGIDENNYQSKNMEIIDYVQSTGVENLNIITAGNVPPNPSELLVSTKMITLINVLKQKYDLVIIDGTPCDLVTDSIILSRIVDSTIIVTSYKETKKESLQRVVKNIKDVGGYIAGIVLNKIPTSSRRYGDTYYYYGSILPSIDAKNQSKSNHSNATYTNNDSSKNYSQAKPEDNHTNEEKYEYVNNTDIENHDNISEEKAQDILRQINEYLESEKSKFNKGE